MGLHNYGLTHYVDDNGYRSYILPIETSIHSIADIFDHLTENGYKFGYLWGEIKLPDYATTGNHTDLVAHIFLT